MLVGGAKLLLVYTHFINCTGKFLQTYKEQMFY